MYRHLVFRLARRRLSPPLNISTHRGAVQLQRLVWTAGSSRNASSGSSKRWQTRQAKDKFTLEAQIQGLKSRAAFKLLEINERYRIFKPGQTVVDLGYAPGSWSQVAFDRTRPDGRVIGIDIIPAQPPRGVSTIQGNFLSDTVQQQLINFLQDPERGKAKEQKFLTSDRNESPLTEEDLDTASIVELNEQNRKGVEASGEEPFDDPSEEDSGGVVDVVLSDMSAPWVQEFIRGKNSLSDPYFRMMNTSGNSFRDHAGSMDLCNAALKFAFDTLRTGGTFVCKYYQGREDKDFETRLKLLFHKVHREKPASSRSESREGFFVGLRRKANVKREDILA